MYEKLLGVLEELYILLRHIYDLAVEKKQVLINADNEQLTKIMRLEEEHMLKINRLEQERNRIIQEMVRDKVVSSPLKNLSEIRVWAEANSLVRLQNLTERLLELSKQLKDANETNGYLLKQAINVVTYSVNRMTQAQAAPVYGQHTGSGKVQQQTTNTKKVFDYKA